MLYIVSKNSRLQVYKALAGVFSLFDGHEFEVKSSFEEVLPLIKKGDVVLSLGPQNLESLQANGVCPKNKKVTGLRKQCFDLIDPTGGKVPVMVSYNVGISEVDYGQFVDLQTDALLAMRLAFTGKFGCEYGAYKFVTSLKEYVAEVKALLEEHGEISQGFDTETLGLDRFNKLGYLISLQFTHTPGMAVVWAFPSQKASEDALRDFENQEDLAFLLNDPRIKTCAANGKYDLGWLYEKAGIECENFVFDTTAVGSLLDENRSNGLDVHAKIYAPSMAGYSDEFDRKADKSRMDLELAKDPQAFLLYSGGDPDATLQVRNAQKEQLLQDPQLTRFYVNIMHPALRAFERVERTGVVVDMDEFNQLEVDLKQYIGEKIHEAKAILGGMLVAKHYDPDKQGGLNLTKASLIKDFMFTHHGLNLKPKMTTEKAGEAATSMEHLEMFKDHPEAAAFVKLMGEYSSASKTLGTYIEGFRKHIRSDGRMHPTYYLFAGNKDAGDGGTNTGRLSVKDPAFQTIPKHTYWGKRIRRCYRAPDGYLVLECDYSQGELRVMACLAHEHNMINAYATGLDLHVVTSGTVAGYTYDEMMALKKSDKKKFDAIRQLGKAGNFGLIYGMGVEGFMEYARLQYGVALTYEQANEFRSGFFAQYPNLTVYHTQYKAYAKQHGKVYSPLGRARHLPLINSPLSQVRSKTERQSINSPVQGCLSDMMIWAIAIQNSMGWQEDSPCFGAIHDAGYYYVPEDNAEFYAKRTVEVMENLPFQQVGWEPQLKFLADAKIGKNMSDLEEMKFNEPIQQPARKAMLWE